MSQRSPYRVCGFCGWKVDTDNQKALGALRQHIYEEHPDQEEEILNRIIHDFESDPLELEAKRSRRWRG